ncbi:MAG: DUF6198 family protein [Evtepia sp.]
MFKKAAGNKIYLRGEVALVVIAILNSFSVYLMLHSRGGISSISSVPYVFSEALPQISLGAWTYIFQTSLIICLMIMRRKFVLNYVFAFFVGGAFSVMMDVHALWIDPLPQSLPYCILYFAISFVCLAFGIALSNHCTLPIIPTDLFPRELALILNRPYKQVKTLFDLSCLTITVVLCISCLGEIRGIGIGTVLCAFTMGKTIAIMGTWLTHHFVFVSFLSPAPQIEEAKEKL